MHTYPLLICKLIVFDHIVSVAFSAAALLQLVSTITPVHLMNTFKQLVLSSVLPKAFGYISCYANLDIVCLFSSWIFLWFVTNCYPRTSQITNCSQKLKGQHYLCTADKEMRHLRCSLNSERFSKPVCYFWDCLSWFFSLCLSVLYSLDFFSHLDSCLAFVFFSLICLYNNLLPLPTSTSFYFHQVLSSFMSSVNIHQIIIIHK